MRLVHCGARFGLLHKSAWPRSLFCSVFLCAIYGIRSLDSFRASRDFPAVKRVLDVARQYQFTPYKNIRDQLSVSSHTIALIVPDVASPFFSGLITAIELQGCALGYAIKYANFAASLSVTRSGNIASADYKSMLDLHFGTIL